ncbi:MAG: Trm112 family protein [Hyphomonadaceae bacterium]
MTNPTDPEVADSQTTGPSLLFLQTLICPLSKGPLTYDREARELISKKAGVAFPVRDGVPIMLEDEARDLTEAERS